MRLLTTFILLWTATSMCGQYIDGPANIRNRPNGEKLFSINNLVSIEIEDQSQNGWKKIKLNCYVKPSQLLLDKKTIKQNSKLLNSEGDSIGSTLTQFIVDDNYNENYRKYKELQLIEVGIAGYTFKDNIRQELTKTEILSNKKSYADSCQNTFITFQREDGLYITLIHKCSLYETSILIDDNYVPTFIKETQDIKKMSGAEGQQSQIQMQFKTDYYSNKPLIKHFSVEADAVEIRGKLIKAVKYGCCGGENSYQAFNSSTFNKLMDYESKIYTVNIPNSQIEGYLGFMPSGYIPTNGKMRLGSLTFTDGKRVINKVHFITNDKQKFDNILRFVPDMEFVAVNHKDDVKDGKDEIELWTKNFSKSAGDLSGFQLLIHFIDDSNNKSYTQKLDFTNGYINGNSSPEFDIYID